MMDVFLFGATVAVTTAYMKKKKNGLSAAEQDNEDIQQLRQRLVDRTSLNATERICIVTPDNSVIKGGGLRAEMRLHNLWHRATVRTDECGSNIERHALVWLCGFFHLS